MSSTHPTQLRTVSPTVATNNQDELSARRKMEQKRRFQQKQGHVAGDVDSLMQSMFSDLKLQSKPTPSSASESMNSVLYISGTTPTNHSHQPVQSHVASPGAADWSKIAFDDELSKIFHHDEKSSNIPAMNSEEPSASHHSVGQQLPSVEFFYPSWCSQSIAFLPLVYQQVYEASYAANAIQTSILYPILLLSGLRQDQLSQIWSQVNIKQPGTLVKEELFMALALIALAQNSNGQVFSNDCLYHLSEIPVPHFQIQQERPAVPSPPPPPPAAAAAAPAYAPPIVITSLNDSSLSNAVYQQDDFADFTSFEQAKQNSNTNDDNIVNDLNENSLCPPNKMILSPETQSIASLDLPTINPNVNNLDDASQKGVGDNVSYSSLSNNEIASIVDEPSSNSIDPCEPSKLELTQFSYFSDDASQIDSHTSVWLRCLERCHSIFSQANQTFTSIESPTLCMEVLQQARTRDYVRQLQEIFLVQKRIYTAALQEPMTVSHLTTLWKQIIVLWTNLQSFFSTAHLHLLNDDDICFTPLLGGDASSCCSICLLSTLGLDTVLPSSASLNNANITFAGRLYHASCANFYLNLIDGILPSLRK